MLAGFTSQTVTHWDKLETVLPGCFLCFQGDSDHYIPVEILMVMMIINEDCDFLNLFKVGNDDNEV